MSAKPQVNPYLALVTGVLGVSTGAIFARLADAPPLVIAAYRAGLATLFLLPVAWWKARDEIRGLSAKDFKLAALSGFFLALHFATWITSLDYTTVANSVVLVNTTPIWVGLLMPFVLHERVGRGTVWGILFSVAGTLIIGLGDAGSGHRGLLGDGLALTGGLFGALYILLGRNLRRRLSLLAYVTICYGCAAAILWAIVLVLRLPVTGYSAGTVSAFIAMALISQIIGHSSYNWALKWFSAGLIAVSLLGEPVIGTILAWFLFEEGLTVMKLVGGLLILAGIYAAAREETWNVEKKVPA